MNTCDSFESSLPPIESFYSKLNDENVSEKDYKFEKMSGQKGFARNLGDCHDLYLKTDVVVLAGVFQEFRKNMSEKL